VVVHSEKTSLRRGHLKGDYELARLRGKSNPPQKKKIFRTGGDLKRQNSTGRNPKGRFSLKQNSLHRAAGSSPGNRKRSPLTIST
jgi:hypothetical protein